MINQLTNNTVKYAADINISPCITKQSRVTNFVKEKRVYQITTNIRVPEFVPVKCRSVASKYCHAVSIIIVAFL